MNTHARTLHRVEDLLLEREANYVETVKESYSDKRKRSEDYYAAMIRIKKDAWLKALFLFRIFSRVCGPLSV